MDALLSVDRVAHIRFASVHFNFEESGDFTKFIEKITAMDATAAEPRPEKNAAPAKPFKNGKLF